MVRRKGIVGSTISYLRRPEEESADEKLSWLDGAVLKELTATAIKPNIRQDWLGISDDTEWNNLFPLADAATKSATAESTERSIFKLYSLGVITQRDEWVYGESEKLKDKLDYFINHYESERRRWHSSSKSTSLQNFIERSIKWNEELEGYILNNTKILFDSSLIVEALYRPFSKQHYYYDTKLSHSAGQMPNIFPLREAGAGNRAITTMGDSSGKPFLSLAVDKIVDLNFVSPASGGSRCYSRYRYTKSGERIDNITDWALNKFVKEYGKKDVTKDAIFHYAYAVLHDPVYRETYALNLKREFPRIPFYPDFARWAAWGETLMALHIGYEDVAPWPVERIDVAGTRAAGTHPKPILKSQPEAGVVVIDADTQIAGIPSAAWAYRLGNRSAIDWVLDQHKEKKPRDPTIAAKFNTYRFADYKESMIALLAKVVRVSIDTVAITDAMRALPRADGSGANGGAVTP